MSQRVFALILSLTLIACCIFSVQALGPEENPNGSAAAPFISDVDAIAEAVTGCTLSVTSEPSGASIILDGSDTGATTPADIADVSARTHNVTVVMDGYLPGIDETVDGAQGGATAVSFVLTPEASGAVPLAVAFTDSSTPPPAASFSGTPTSGTAPLTVTFTDLSTGSPTGRAWFFGDETYAEPWTEVNAGAGWAARYCHSSVALPDGSIVLMGGLDNAYNDRNDVWRSTDNGTTWTAVTAGAGWAARYGHSSVALPDGSIVLIGGFGLDNGLTNDVWRSTDNGATWTEVTAGAGWTVRSGHSSVTLPDGSVVLIGGRDSGGVFTNDVWRFQPAGSSLRNPSHTYTAPGTYSVTLQAFNTYGSTVSTAVDYITVGAGTPLVTDPAATPSVIPTNTDGSPEVGETTTLSVTVAGADIASVTIDLSAIGGSPTTPMTSAGSDTWTAIAAGTVASPYASDAYQPALLTVNATNAYGISNTTVTIPLTVVKNGDANEDNKLSLYDAVHTARHTLGIEGYPMTESVGMVSGGDTLSLHDAVYLAKYVLAIPGYEQLH